MRSSSRIAFCAALAVTMLAPGARAQEAELDFDRTGWFVAVGAGVAVFPRLEDELEDDLGGGLAADVDPTAVMGLRIGTRLHRFVAAEVQLDYVPELDTEAVGARELGTLEAVSTTANVRVYPLGGRVQPYGLLGVGLLNAKLSGASGHIDGIGAAFRMGAGLEAYVTPHIAIDLGASYLLPTGDVEKYDSVQAGLSLVFRF